MNKSKLAVTNLHEGKIAKLAKKTDNKTLAALIDTVDYENPP